MMLKIFISYSTKDTVLAEKLLAEMEKLGHDCFYAPRDIKGGERYAERIFQEIRECDVFLLVLSQAANDSQQVLREINVAVSWGRNIIPLKIEDVFLSDTNKYYLGVCQWIEMSENYISDILKAIDKNTAEAAQNAEKQHGYVYEEMTIIPADEREKINYDSKRLAMRQIEIDYLMVPDVPEEYEGNLEDWSHSIDAYELGTSALLVQKDEVVGYIDVYPVTDEAYEELISGREMINEDMFELFEFGGDFHMYISVIGIIPQMESYRAYLLIFDWFFRHLAEWKARRICAKNIGVSVYGPMLEKFVKKLGFSYVRDNLAGGKIYEISYAELISTQAAKNRYGNLDL